jgi:rubrerythrin
MCDIAKLTKFLTLIETVETKASELYAVYQDRFKEDDEDASYFFYRMYVEEKGHAALAAYVKYLVRKNPKLFEQVNGDDIELDGLPQLKEKLTQRIAEAKDITLEAAIANTLELETSFGEGYGLIKLSDFVSHAPKIARLLKNLTDCKEHTEAVTVFARERGIVT